MARLLQIDFPLTGPWGDEAAAAFRELAETIAQTPGLRWKIWTENQQEERTGGIYLFDDQATLDAFLAEHRERLRSFGIQNARAISFAVNDTLTAMTNGPVGA